MAPTLRVRDRIVLVGFAVVWVWCMVMRVLSFSHPAPHTAYVNAWSNGGYPVVEGFYSEADQAQSSLALADRILRVGNHDLHDTGQLGYGFAMADVVSRTSGPVPIAIQRDDQRMLVSEALPARTLPSRYTGLPIALVWGSVAILILLRAPRTSGSRALFFALASQALMYTAAFETRMPLYAIVVLNAAVATLATQALLIRAYLSFPEEANSLRGWHRVWPWAFTVVGLLLFSAEGAFPFSPTVARPLATMSVVAYVLALMLVMTKNYRRSGPVGRRQIKWVVYFAYVGAVLSLVTYAIVGVSPGDAPVWTYIAVMLASIGYPLAILIAVLRFDLFDIDRLIGATLAYNLLAIAVVGAGLLVVPVVTRDLAAALGIDPVVGQSGLVLGMSCAAVLGQRRVRPHVDRLFFKERFALERAMTELPETLASLRQIDDLFQTAGNALVTHLRPRSCVIFASAGAAFAPLFSGGETMPPLVASDSELVTWLRGQGGAVSIERRTLRHIGLSGKALLTRLEARVAVPIHRNQQLAAFVCLGEKRSGDIYTATDLALLTALAKSLAMHLLRFDEAELLERSRVIQEKMRRYVPDAVAQEIAQGRELESGEREVSVLFVDIRGYTAFSDGRDASAIFSTVNHYTAAVSQIVRDAGGVCVEFNGDGMMAVFGAPIPLADKESASVRAARRLVTEVPQLQGSELAAALSVGVGITTGLAFLGNIQAVDRTIWTAIGSSVNLAARLQSLTRELNASILLDATTRERAGDGARGFVEHRDMAIRGRQETATVYALPLDEAGAAA